MRRIDGGLPGVSLLEPTVFEDKRGFFFESYNRRTLAGLDIHTEFVQDNHSRSVRGVLRGLHFQLEHPQAKLVRTTVGRVWDVVVDLRRGSPTFGRWWGAELSAANRLQLFAPEGFAHGFVVLSDVAEFQYKCSDYYDPEDDRGILWNDPDIAVDWPLGVMEPILSAKDRRQPRLAELGPSDLPSYREGGRRDDV